MSYTRRGALVGAVIGITLSVIIAFVFLWLFLVGSWNGIIATAGNSRSNLIAWIALYVFLSCVAAAIVAIVLCTFFVSCGWVIGWLIGRASHP